MYTSRLTGLFDFILVWSTICEEMSLNSSIIASSSSCLFAFFVPAFEKEVKISSKKYSTQK